MNLTILLEDKLKKIQVNNDSPDNLVDILMNEGIYIAANCGRMGICGKCDIVIKEIDSVSSDEKKLACKTTKDWLLNYDNLTIQVNNYMLDPDMKIEEGYAGDKTREESTSDNESSLSTSKSYNVAIDIGTTTIVFALVDYESNRVVATSSRVNSQRKYGADVISRINMASSGRLEDLRKCIVEDVVSGINEMCTDNGTYFDRAETTGVGKEMCLSAIRTIIITGNTTMCHILMGYDCSGLGSYPYAPVNIKTIVTDTQNVLGIEERIPVIIPPGFTTFVGADITSGVLAIHSGRNLSSDDSNLEDAGMSSVKDDNTFILIDLGTNAEMVLRRGHEFVVTSTAAGPAFEGVNISCGVASVEGAISHFEIRDGLRAFDTIGGKEPIGICGSGLVDIIYELRKNDIIDENGILIDKYIQNGYKIYKDIALTQDDIRQFLLAKAAIRAGLEILLEESGIIYSDVDKLYISGGFGSSIDIHKASSIGIIPLQLRDKAEAVGNSSIGGAITLASSICGKCDSTFDISKRVNDVNIDYLEAITSNAKEVNLSLHKDFQNKYMTCMCIEREE